MAESEGTQGIQNRWLILTAVVLGILVVVIYNAHVNAIRAGQEADTIEIVMVTKDLKVGDRISKKDIRAKEIPASSRDSYGSVIYWEERDRILGRRGARVVTEVDAPDFLLWSHIERSSQKSLADKIPLNHLVVPLEFDSSESLSSLQVGDRVNIVGMFSPDGKGMRAFRAIEAVPVLSIAGEGAASTSRSKSKRSYKNIEILLDKEVSLKLDNLKTHKSGSLMLELVRANRLPSNNDGKINPALEKLAERAKTSTSRATKTSSFEE